MTGQPDSPHLTAGRAQAELYVGWAGIDPFAPLEQMAPFPARPVRPGIAV